jgi:hypothetical protein
MNSLDSYALRPTKRLLGWASLNCIIFGSAMRLLPVRLFSLVQVKAFAANVKPAGLWGSGDSPALHAFFVSAAVPRLFHKKNLTSIYLVFYRAKYFALPPTNKCVAAPVASYRCELSAV